MKNKILSFFVLLSLFATSCSTLESEQSTSELDIGNTYLSIKSSQIILPDTSAAGNEIESIAIQSLRILVFSEPTGEVVTNKKFVITDLSLAQKINGEWVVDFENMVVATKSGPSTVYVVLNENVMSISQQSLTSALDGVQDLAAMENLVKTPLSYSQPLQVQFGQNGKPIEPPFIMSTFDQFNIASGKTAANPYVADFRGPSTGKRGFELDRTMAKITLDSISSYPRNTGDITDNVQTSFIFILKTGLVNVPKQYMWSPGRAQSPLPNPNPYPNLEEPYNGGFQMLDFGLENNTLGYYERTWNGSLSATVKVDVIWRQYGIGNIYKIKNNSGVKSYGTNPNEAFLFPDTIPNINNGNFLSFLKEYFAEGGGVSFSQGNINYLNPTIQSIVHGDYWSLNEKNISYYIPEHFLTDKTNPADATKLHVRASIATMPVFDPQNISYNENDIKWDAGGTQNKPNWTYPTNNVLDGLIRNTFTAVPKPNGFWHVWNGALLYREARGKLEINLNHTDFTHITDGNIQDFYLPIRSSSGDYNIYRNHEYKVSVHALEQWIPSTTTSGTFSRSKSSIPEREAKGLVIQYNTNK